MTNTLDLTSLSIRLNHIALWCWGLMLTTLPFSTALALLFSAFGAVFSVLGLRPGPLLAVVRSPIALCALLLFGWLAFSSIWAVAPRAELIEGVWKYRKLIFVVLVATSLVVCRKNPGFLINFFLAGCAIVAFGSLSSRFGVMEYVLGPPASTGGWPIGGTAQKSWLYIGGPDNPTFGRNHITQGAFLVFASMFATGRSWSAFRVSTAQRYRGFLWALIAIFYLLPVFSIQGRSGYLLAFLGAGFWVVFSAVSLRGWKRLVPGTLVVLVLGVMVSTSPHFLKRSNEAVEDVVRYSQTGEQTSQGIRIRFWRAGLELATERPLLGYGAGGYAQAYSQLADEPQWLRVARSQPHSEYVILLVQGGLVALALFVILAVASTRSTWGGLISPDGPGLVGVAILFFAYSSFNSAVWDLAEGHFFPCLVGLAITTVRVTRSEAQPTTVSQNPR